MIKRHLIIKEIGSNAKEFDEAYSVINSGIEPQYMESPRFLRERLRISERGAKTSRELIIVPPAHVAHLLIAMMGLDVVGAIAGCYIPEGMTPERGIGFVGYLSVIPEYQRKGIAWRLVKEFQTGMLHDAAKAKKKPEALVFEVEFENDAVKQFINRHGGYAFDIRYLQPVMRKGYRDVEMELFYMPFQLGSVLNTKRFDRTCMDNLIKNILRHEYSGYFEKMFDLRRAPYRIFKGSLGSRQWIGLKKI